jgi:hypothetical protein
MMRILKEKEKEAVLRLGGIGRYRHCVTRAADEEQLWGLWQDGWAMAGVVGGGEAFPVWPHCDYAELCAQDDWAGYAPKAIALEEWMTRWLPGLQKDERLVAVFPLLIGQGFIVGPARMTFNLEEMLKGYE